MQNKFAFFANFAETIREALPQEKQAEAYKAICEYGIYGILPEDPMLKGMCLMAKISINKVDGRSKNGGNHNPSGINQHKKEVNSGQSWSKEVNSVQSGQFLSETETETETETEKEGVCIKRARDDVGAPTHSPEEKKSKTNFYPPTVEEVSAYCLERKNGVNPAKFVDFYASKGWMVGKNKMKDWRAAVRNWERDDPPKNPAANDDEKCWF